jgi:hypothetical protein
MAAGFTDLEAILKLRKGGTLPEKFSIVEIGAQQIANNVLRDGSIMSAYAETFGVPLRSFGKAPEKSNMPGITELLPPDAPPAKAFWEWLGCTYAAVDIDTSPHAIPLDLNFDDVPAEHMGKYQLVTNLGTTEHVANQNQAMKIIHDLTAPGGVMIHNVPAQGNSNHGLINYNLKFFWMLARSCRYRWLDVQFISDSVSVPISPDIVGEIAKFHPERAGLLKDHQIVNSALLVIFQKYEDIPFVPPIDMHTGGVVDDQRIRSRYWTVFGGEKPTVDASRK